MLRVTVELLSFHCSACGGEQKGGLLKGKTISILEKWKGRCPTCRRDRFDATIKKTVFSHEGPSAEDIGAAIVVGVLSGGIAVPQSKSDISTKEYEIRAVTGVELLKKLKRPPEEVLTWITAILKAEAKANLRPGQGICRTCDEIYNVAFSGPTTQGYCSPICLKKAQKAAGTAAPAAAPEAAAGKQIYTCPHCKRKFKGPADAPQVHCTWCSKPLFA